MSKADQTMIRSLQRAFRAQADSERAAAQQAYMKSAMPFYGITTPELRRIVRAQLAARPFGDRARGEATVLALWRGARYREERHAALELLGHRRHRDWLDPALMPLLKELIVSGAWWDYVDGIAVNMVGPILAGFPAKLRPLLTRWSTGQDIWLRRTAILAQLKFKAATDPELLFRFIEPSIGEREFFLRKAIGWALREYSKTEPQIVIDYVNSRSAELSGLSKREAFRVLVKRGRVSAPE